uniref:Uncharacterized protein n=1 Tax=Physcomitrium patens TaxID=3218 RepID=A0A7I3Z659_PHYPA
MLLTFRIPCIFTQPLLFLFLFFTIVDVVLKQDFSPCRSSLSLTLDSCHEMWMFTIFVSGVLIAHCSSPALHSRSSGQKANLQDLYQTVWNGALAKNNNLIHT